MLNSTHKSVLGIVGSPRREGNTEILVDYVLKGAKEAGASIEKIILNELKINPCQACNTCYKTGACQQDDDMANLLDKMVATPIWVLGTPIYWWGPTAQFKIFLDRWYSPRHREFKGKRVILVVPLGGDHERYARYTIGMLKDALEYLGMDLMEIIIAPGVNRRGAIRRKSEILEKARTIGKKAVNQ